jgi:hypothetical protein
VNGVREQDLLWLALIVISLHQCAVGDAIQKLNVINVKVQAMKKKKQQKKEVENKFVPFHLPIRHMVNWWTKNGDGNFNIDLYLQLCRSKEMIS